MAVVMNGMNPAAAAICEALGLNPKTIRRLVFSIDVDSITVVTIERYLMEEDAEGMATILQQFELVEKQVP